MKAFYKRKIPKSSYARKETVAIDILRKSRNGDRITMPAIKEWTLHQNKEVEPVPKVQMNKLTK